MRRKWPPCVRLSHYGPMFVKLVVQVRLLPKPEQASALEATLHACNRAATHASAVAFAKGLKDRNGLQREVYAELKAN